MNKLLELRWPIGIAVATIGLVIIGAITISKALSLPVVESDYFHAKYQEADLNGDKIFLAQIAFNKLYTVEQSGIVIDMNNSVVAYKITDKAGKPVNDAELEVIVTRPNTKTLDINLSNPVVENGVYRYTGFTLPKAGRWDILARITIGDNQRIYNLKADTRYELISEF